MPTKYDDVKSNDGQIPDATQVELVPAPSANQAHIVKSLTIHNTDTVNATVKVAVQNGANVRVLYTSVLAPSYTFTIDAGEVIHLDSTSKSLIAFLGGAVTTNPLDFNASYDILS